ncbi:hypothetical protein [Planktothrix agardhii]|jgi:hypothetical protein|uniref:Uncharacterized protein n=1 Tax=Planktothrix agardhii (strain NIVA-CYA 126/8) TaxID=388467 RepID=A0A073CGQ5_PLAA1|nr:hypothetical protein [Planktothrix agardhii]KEI66833.1 hypothetical protein A19Y_1845 [Planktothrix agardhii NIVA-CYA 126/8]MCF3624713.1 hypothetical protein [Planktothrix agardhii 1801]CAD5962387.1 hypothetical protein NIVACYA_03716 [Planktothrix agardhii]
MLGTFQHSSLRIEVNAKEADIRDSLLRPSQLQKWLWPQQFNPGLPEQFQPGLTFTTSLGPVTIQHYVDVSQPNCLRLLLSQGIDGFHEWYWGEGWIQSRLEGISILPLNLGQTISLIQLREFLVKKNIPQT